MLNLKSYLVAFCAAFVVMCSLGEVSAQTTGDVDQKSYMNKRTNKKVSVTVSDLEWSDMLSYGAIKELLSSGFASGANLEVEDLNFAPDFKSNAYFLSFTLEDEDDTKVVILDVAGNEIHSETIEEFEGTYESQINLPASASGTYFLKVIQGFSLLNKKLVIE